MGDPKKQRKKYSTPLKRWDKEAIEGDRKLIKGYGLKNKRELFKFVSLLRRIKHQAKNLAARKGMQAEKEKEGLFKKLLKLSLIKEGARLEDILELKVDNLLSRRLQSQVVKAGLARTASQARQFIVHGHILVGKKKTNIPSYLVLKTEENDIAFGALSPFVREDHPEREKKHAVQSKDSKGADSV